jgi:ATP-dependent Lhr-like helicase
VAANDDSLPIGIHHGSLAREAARSVEAAMVEGDLRAIVCTGSLDLGIDWGDVDLVIQVGAPKNVKRLVQRIGRANHRYNAPSKALSGARQPLRGDRMRRRAGGRAGTRPRW